MGGFFSALGGFGQSLGEYGKQQRQIASSEKMHTQSIASSDAQAKARLEEDKRQKNLENWRALQNHALSNIDMQLNKMSPSSPGFDQLTKLRGRMLQAVPNDPANQKLWEDYGQHHQVHDDHVDHLNGLMNGFPGQPTGPNVLPDVGQAPGSNARKMTAPTAPFIPPVNVQPEDNQSRMMMPGIQGGAPNIPDIPPSPVAGTMPMPMQMPQPTPGVQQQAGSQVVTGAEHLPPVPPPPPFNPHAGTPDGVPRPIQPQGAAQPAGNPIAGHARIQTPQVQLPPPGVTPGSSFAHNFNPLIDQGMNDIKRYGYTSPQLEEQLRSYGSHVMPVQFQQEQMQQGIQYLQQTGEWNKIPEVMRVQMMGEAHGIKPPSANGIYTPHLMSSGTLGSQFPQGTLDKFGNPVDPNTLYRELGSTAMGPIIEPIAPQTATAPTAQGGVGMYNKKTGGQIGPVEGAVAPSMMPTVRTSERLANVDGKIQAVPTTSTSSKGGVGATSATGATGATQPGQPRVLGDSPAFAKMKTDNPLTPAGQKIMQSTDQTKANIEQALKLLKNGKDDNMPLSHGLSTALYKLGISSEGSALVNTINVADLQAASQILPPGGSRALTVLQKALEHTPNTKIDSQKLMREKLENILRNLTEAQTAVRTHMQSHPGLDRSSMPAPSDTGATGATGASTGNALADFKAKHGLK